MTEQKDQNSPVAIWRQLFKSYKTIERNLSSRLSQNYKQGLTRYDVLNQLHQCKEEWVRVGDLTDLLLDMGGNISSLLNRMEKDRLIERRLNPNDRRSFQVGLTPQGEDLRRQIASDFDHWVSDALQDVTAEERDVLNSILRKLQPPNAQSEKT